MNRPEPMSLEAFAILAEQRGLKMEDAGMLARLYDGYCSLQTLLGRFPAEPDPALEPAMVFVPEGTDLVR
jgi:hypothetical protein